MRDVHAPVHTNHEQRGGWSRLCSEDCDLIQRDVQQPHGEAAASGEEAGSGPNIKGSHNCSGLCVPSLAAAAIISYIL